MDEDGGGATAISHYHKNKNQDMMMVREVHIENDQQFIHPDHLDDEYLVSLVNNLPDGCRLVFNLYSVEGYSHSEIADMLKISEGTSRSQFHHAKHLLKKKLKCQTLVHYYEKFA